ncbi:MAG: PAS domain S-box protein, partial [Chloroflexi bacterium]|nr:PAS domain S-box protein [Chloroflexota bacterium]
MKEELRVALEKRRELEAIINRSPAVVFLWRAAEGWPVEFVSDNIAQFGYSPDDFTSGRIPYADIVYAEDLARVADEVNRYSREGRAEFTQEYRILTRYGEVRWLDDRTFVRRDSTGTITHYQGIVIDITERKRAEEERERLLAQVEQHRKRAEELARTLERERGTLQAIIENTHTQLAYLDPEFNFVMVNSAYAQDSGHTKEELVGRNHFELFPNPENQAIFEMVRDTGQPVEFHAKPFEYADQPWRGVTYWDWTLAPAKDEAGRVRGLVFSLLNVTEQIRAQEALRQAKEYSEKLIETANVMIIGLDAAGNIRVFNDAAEEITGYTRDELSGRDWFEVLVPRDRYPGVWEMFTEAMAGGVLPRTFDNPILTKSGEERCISWRNSELREQGKITGTISFGLDITERMQMEEALRKAHAELETRVQERTAELAKANEDLRLEIAEHKRAKDELQMRERQQAAIAELGQPALAGIDLSRLMDEAVVLLAKTLEVEYAKVLELLPDGKALLLRAGVGWKEGYVGHATVGSGVDSQAGYTLLSHEPVIVEDLRTETRFSGPPLLREHGVVSGVSVIISGRDRPFGVLGAHTTRRRTFNRDDINFLQAIANVLAMAIERKQAEEERERLLENIEQWAEVAQGRAAELQGVLDNMVDGVFVCNVEGRVTLANESAVQMLGLAGLEEVKRALADLSALVRMRHPDGRPFASEELPLARALAGEIVVAEEAIVYNRRTQQDIYVRASTAPIKDARGEIVGAVGVVRDVTELTELDRLKDQFISVAAHELKTPVTIMKGYAQVLLRTYEDLPEPSRRMLDAIDRGADRINALVEDLLDISMLQVGRLELVVERIDLPELVRGVVDRMALTTTKHRIRVVKAEPVVVQGDRERLGEVLINLIDNAIRYSPQGGDVDVAVNVQEREAVVSVRDCGVGIPKEKQARIF